MSTRNWRSEANETSAMGAQVNWTGRVALWEFCAVFFVSYGASALYHILIWGNLSRQVCISRSAFS
jgi:hypothetical protein